MHFSEARGFALLTILLACGIMLVDRLAPEPITRPTQIMVKAMDNAEKTARLARAPETENDTINALAKTNGSVSGAPPQPSGAIGTIIATTGFRCPFVRRVLPLTGGDGICRIVCADQPSGGTERGFRVDTRKGSSAPESGPIA